MQVILVKKVIVMNKKLLSIVLFTVVFFVKGENVPNPLNVEEQMAELLRGNIARSQGTPFIVFLRRGTSFVRFSELPGRNMNHNVRQGRHSAGSARTRGVAMTSVRTVQGRVGRQLHFEDSPETQAQADQLREDRMRRVRPFLQQQWQENIAARETLQGRAIAGDAREIIERSRARRAAGIGQPEGQEVEVVEAGENHVVLQALNAEQLIEDAFRMARDQELPANEEESS